MIADFGPGTGLVTFDTCGAPIDIGARVAGCGARSLP